MSAAQLRTRTFRTFMYATAAVLESWRNLYDGKAGLPTKAAVAGHRSVRRKTCRPVVPVGGTKAIFVLADQG